jgi:glycosyltransferase involved in cell wall biosynthesis
MLSELRILLVGPLPPPSGGMANQTRQLARLLSESGITVELVRNNPPYWPAWIERLKKIRAAFRLGPYLARVWRGASRVDLVHVMANSGWAWHLYAAPAIWLACLRGKPVVVNYRGGEAESFFSRQWRWIRPTLARASAVVVPSRFLEGVFARFGVSTLIVPNIIDLERFKPGEPSGEGPLIVVTRNLEDIYDIPTALRAFAAIRRTYPPAKLIIAGSGPRREALEALARALEMAEAVRFTGHLDNERVVDLYRDAHLMLNPSLADNMPISLLEAMASGVPVVSTDVGGIPFLVQDGLTALLVPPADPEAMARAALRILGDPALSLRLRAAGIEMVQQYTWPCVRERLLAVYARVLGRVFVEHCSV